jgi:cyclohexadienyl dehydratase
MERDMVFERKKWLALIHVLFLSLCLVPLSYSAYGDVSPLASSAEQAQLVDEAGLISELLTLVGERLDVMPAVAAAKWPTHAAISDPAREGIVVEAARTRAREMGLAPEPVAEFFALQMSLARKVQEQLTMHWAAKGYDYSGPALTLAGDLRPRLDHLTDELLTALYLIAPFTARPEFMTQAESLTTRTFSAGGWTNEDRAALVASLTRLRLIGPSTVQRARAAGVLRIGTPADYAPFSARVDSHVTGADVVLASALAHEMGLKPVFIKSSWKTLFSELAEDRFDMVIGGVSITPARLGAAHAGPPLSRSGKTAIGRCVDQTRLTTLSQIDKASIRVIENTGGTNEAFAKNHLTSASLILYPDNQTVFVEIFAGRADVMFTDEIEIDLMTQKEPTLCRLLKEAFETTDKTFFYQKNGHWEDVIDPWLNTAVHDGLPARLLQQAIHSAVLR